ncbi:MAG TPA: hypothetical protein VGO21_00925 [Candidatus Paceibacterota bacterium]|nr:hypothetical protein [Candidatus Paceibacterota bacterium]
MQKDLVVASIKTTTTTVRGADGGVTTTTVVEEVHSGKTPRAGKLELDLRKEDRKEKNNSAGCGWFGCPVVVAGYGCSPYYPCVPSAGIRGRGPASPYTSNGGESWY